MTRPPNSLDVMPIDLPMEVSSFIPEPIELEGSAGNTLEIYDTIEHFKNVHALMGQRYSRAPTGWTVLHKTVFRLKEVRILQDFIQNIIHFSFLSARTCFLQCNAIEYVRSKPTCISFRQLDRWIKDKTGETSQMDVAKFFSYLALS